MSYSNFEVAHIWAQQQRQHASGSNFYFEANSIYSYGSHFECGRIIRNTKGETAYMVNTSSFSVTTSKHQSITQRAIPSGSTVFYLNGKIDERLKCVFGTYIHDMRVYIQKSQKARTYAQHYMAQAQDQADKMRNYAQFQCSTKKAIKEALKDACICTNGYYYSEDLNLCRTLMNALYDYITSDTNNFNTIIDACKVNAEEHQKRIQEQAKAAHKAAAERDKKDIEKDIQSLDEYLIDAHKTSLYLSQAFINKYGFNAVIKYNEGQGIFITSKGFKVTTQEAKRVFNACKIIIKNEALTNEHVTSTTGTQVGFYSLSKKDNDYIITIGCHALSYNNLLAIAFQFGWIESTEVSNHLFSKMA